MQLSQVGDRLGVMTSYTIDIQCDEYFQIHDSYITRGLTKKVKHKLTIIGDTIDASCGTDFVSNMVFVNNIIHCIFDWIQSSKYNEAY